jgi:succinate dehydrogenase/fumarate reductase cytochrome b subunit
MKTIETRIILTAIITVLVLVTGVILNKKGKPYNEIITTVHKLLSLAIIVLSATIVYHQHKLIGLQPPEILLITLSALCFLSALVSGGLLTIEKPMPKYVNILHRLSSILSIGFSAFTIYLFY